ncbi:hypothetical protein CYLTODRAFT_447167 [Cylindrobasidium torrendii FP15055 ss-10]|uniref:Uncharacterized protein n=1 Tax=Cylindrobasidium torrendii FP15055 ss-10 TaxID=1314674 RepID=A0A0D7AX91_9AGAR|nr:hypothetical protein CYLTODRAFT_447167 [Cylindrobasidium torrendii FP15055 ss-10]
MPRESSVAHAFVDHGTEKRQSTVALNNRHFTHQYRRDASDIIGPLASLWMRTWRMADEPQNSKSGEWPRVIGQGENQVNPSPNPTNCLVFDGLSHPPDAAANIPTLAVARLALPFHLSIAEDRLPDDSSAYAVSCSSSLMSIPPSAARSDSHLTSEECLTNTICPKYMSEPLDAVDAAVEMKD